VKANVTQYLSNCAISRVSGLLQIPSAIPNSELSLFAIVVSLSCFFTTSILHYGLYQIVFPANVVCIEILLMHYVMPGVFLYGGLDS